ncbi:MAG: metalloregulator ArsR/SmtB family transcription factor [Candidatus Omnitrophota bacterium]
MSVKKVRLVLKACAEDTRLRIISLLEGEELPVGEICRTLKVSQSVISKHLSRLRFLKIVTDRRRGNRVFYTLTNKTDSFQYEIVAFLQAQCKDIPSLKIDKKSLQRPKN